MHHNLFIFYLGFQKIILIKFQFQVNFKFIGYKKITIPECILLSTLALNHKVVSNYLMLGRWSTKYR